MLREVSQQQKQGRVSQFFPPREIRKYQMTEETQQQAAESLQLKNKLRQSMEYILFSGRLPSGQALSNEEMGQLEKDQANFLKVMVGRLDKKYPYELTLSLKEVLSRHRQWKRKYEKDIEDGPKKKRKTMKGLLATKVQEQKDDQDFKLDLQNPVSDVEDQQEFSVSAVEMSQSDSMGEDAGDYGDDM